MRRRGCELARSCLVLRRESAYPGSMDMQQRQEQPPGGRPDRNLPDLILVDLGPAEPLLVFVEVVATAGPVNKARQTALMAVGTEAGFNEDQVAFVTAYADRDEAAFMSSVSELAGRSFVWLMSEPDHIVVLQRGSPGENPVVGFDANLTGRGKGSR